MSKIAVPGGNSKVFWYKAEPRKMLDDLLDVEPAEFGYLVILRNLMFLHDGFVVDDPKFLARYLGLKPKSWQPIRDKFIGLGKAYVDDAGRLRSRTVDAQLAESAEARERSSETWKKRKENEKTKRQFPNDINGDSHTDTVTVTEEKIDRGERPPAGAESSPTKGSSEEARKENLSSPPTCNSETSEAEGDVPRGQHPLPDGWAASPENISYAMNRGWARDVVLLEAERFINYHRMHDKRFKDWNHVWRNWVVSPYFGASSKNGQSGKPTVQEAAWNLHERVAARAAEISPGFRDQESGNIVRLLPAGRCQ
jgi:hypothetical protein